MKFSFLVPYRNRDMQRVERCLRSLQTQNFRDFEIVFVDYGSDAPEKTQVEALCKQFDKVRYIYLATQGWLWSRSAALNECFRQARGEYVAIVDIDIIFPPNFLDYYQKHCTIDKVYQYQCYYTPENFDYTQIDFRKEYPFEVSEIAGAGGLMVLSLEMVRKVGGFDEYFCVWGMEDIDFKIRLRSQGAATVPTDFQEIKTFHQWHPSAKKTYLTASSWLTNVEFYHRARTEMIVPYLSQKALEKTADAGVFMNGQGSAKEFQFVFPVIKSFNLFAKNFFSLPAGEAIKVVQTFDAIKVERASKVGKFANWVNKNVLEKARLSYRLTEVLTFESEYVQFDTVRDFLFYFLVENKELIADYHFSSHEENQLTCIIVKRG